MTNAGCTRSRRGLTVVEAMSVLVILTFLGGIALPRYIGYASRTRETALRQTLGDVRAAIAHYYAASKMKGAGSFPSYAELTEGGLLDEPIPINAHTDAAGLRNAEGAWVSDNPPVEGVEGWAYDAACGKFWANSNVQDENKW